LQDSTFVETQFLFRGIQLTEQVLVSWDTFELTQSQAQFLREEDPELSELDAWEFAENDPDLFIWHWEDLEETIGQWLKTYDYPSLRIEGYNMGWQHRSGYMDLRDVQTAKQFLSFLPDTNCTFTIYKNSVDNNLRVENAHHDAPTGEGYRIRIVRGCDLCYDGIVLSEDPEVDICEHCEDLET